MVSAGGRRRGVHRDVAVQRDVAVAQPAHVPAARHAAARLGLEAGRRAASGGEDRARAQLHDRPAQLRRAQQRRGPAAQVGHHRRHRW